jgi:hypothetical protein
MRRRGLIAALCAVPALLGKARAQSATPPTTAVDDQLIAHFYDNPQPARLIGLLDRLQKSAANWNAYPPVTGLLAVVFRQHPDFIDRLVPEHPDAKTAVAIAAALQLAGVSSIAPSLRSRLLAAGTDPTLAAQLAGLPSRLEDLHVVTATHLDILWGASFASGDDRYVRMIADFLAAIANRSELIALDIAKLVVAQAGGPREIYGQLKDRYGVEGGREMVFAAAAAWALESNAKQHVFVDKFLTEYIAAHSGTPAEKLLSALRPRKRV